MGKEGGARHSFAATEWLQKPVPRRTVLKVGAGATLAAFLGACGNEVPASTPRSEQPGFQSEPLSPNPKRIEGKPFGSDAANEVASNLGITAGNYFLNDPKVINRLSAFRGEQLYPIYCPEVMQWKEVIYTVADESGIPPNIAASIMMIESTGRQNVVSQADAYGLWQVIPSNFPKDMRRNTTAMQEPYTNGKYGMQVYLDSLKAARTGHKNEYQADHSNIYAYAAMGYNGGPAVAEENYSDAPTESQFYFDYLTAFFIDCEVADGLRKQGLSDREITSAMSSREIDARGYALSNTDGLGKNPAKVHASRLVLSQDIPGERERTPLERQIHTDYQDYLAGKTVKYAMPLAPAARIWSCSGGASALLAGSLNTNPAAWGSVDTSR